MNDKKILILGATGMAGHMIYSCLTKRTDFDIYTVSYRNKLNSSSIILDITNKELLANIISKLKPNIIINCVGVLIRGANAYPENAILVNAYIPHLLSRIAHDNKAKLIHLSTDCVFSGIKGDYQPSDLKDAQDIYGMSKALGEVINDKDLTIRTSIIGPEIKNNGEGLLHWFLNQKDTIKGYTESYWSGITTLQLAKIIEYSIDNNLSGLLQYSNGNKISKYELLNIFKQVWNKMNIEIKAFPGKKIDKSLIPTYPSQILPVPNYVEMCYELADYMTKHLEQYKQYYFSSDE